MTLEDKLTLHRMLGRIEAVAFMADRNIGEPLLDALEIIDGILDRKDGSDGM